MIHDASKTHAKQPFFFTIPLPFRRQDVLIEVGKTRLESADESCDLHLSNEGFHGIVLSDDNLGEVT
jgi:hypothetical protein